MKLRIDSTNYWIIEEHHILIEDDYAWILFQNSYTELSHWITGTPVPPYKVKYINGNTLDNRNRNLKLVRKR